MKRLIPSGLNDAALRKLQRCKDEAALHDLSTLLSLAEEHLAAVRQIHERNSLINIRLAEVIFQTLQRITIDWQSIPEAVRPWCLAMIKYFASSDDEIDDFDSPIGFEDDAEVLNACLCLAGFEEYCINPEDYDDI